MEKKSNLTQILVILGLIGVAFYLGSSMNGKKEIVQDSPVLDQQVNQNQNQQLTGLDAARQIALEMDIDIEEFNSCVEDPVMSQKVVDQEEAGARAGVRGTPGAFLYDTNTKKSIQLGGAVPLATMEAELAKLKAGEGETIDISPIDDEDFIKGNQTARYALIEWSDYECPYCGKFQETAIQLVEQNSDVKWVYRQFPLDGLHPNARAKSVAALCVGKIAGNDAFWEYSDNLLGL